jgi:hypothetical protein
MKLKAYDSFTNVVSKIKTFNKGSDYIFSEEINDQTYLLVAEKYFFRNSSRASLTVLVTEIDEFQTLIHTIGSGGGTGLFLRIDWGARHSYENEIRILLSNHHIKYEVIE